MTQIQMFYAAQRKLADRDAAMMEMMTCKSNLMTRSDLEALIKRRPQVYGRYAGFLDKLSG